MDFKAMSATSSNIKLDGKNLFLFGSEYKGKTKEDAKMEAHRQYVDIQMPLMGQEQLGWQTIDNCHDVITTYDVEKDIVFFATSLSMYITLHPGEFVIFFTEDVHAPEIGIEELKKVVI